MSAIAYIYGPDGGLTDTLDADNWETYPENIDEGPTIAYLAIVSLLSDARANPDDVPADLDGDPRGWWADTYSNGDRFGSHLWLAEEMGATQASATRAADAARLALQWLIDDGHATAIEANATASGGFIALEVAIDRNEARETFRIPDLWSAYRAA